MQHHLRSEAKEDSETANKRTYTAQRVPASIENDKEITELKE